VIQNVPYTDDSLKIRFLDGGNPNKKRQGSHGHQVIDSDKGPFRACSFDNRALSLQDPKKARTAQMQKWSDNCGGGQVHTNRFQASSPPES
jgi:hypothetical protein